MNLRRSIFKYFFLVLCCYSLHSKPSKIDLEDRPIWVSLYTNGSARATVNIEGKEYWVERSKKITHSHGLKKSQMLYLCCAIEEAFKLNKFRRDLQPVRKRDGDLHSVSKIVLQS